MSKLRQNIVADEWEDIFRNLVEANAAMSTALWSLLLLPLNLEQNGQDSPSQREELRVKIENLRRLLRVAMSGGVDKELFAALNSLARRGPQIERAVVVWVDLFEVLMQTEERRYGLQAGLGSLKIEELKEVFRQLLRDKRFVILGIPDYLQPIVTDVGVGWVVDALVRIANNYGLWEVSPTSSRPPTIFFTVLRFRLRKALRPLWVWAVRAFSRVWNFFRTITPLSPSVRAALQAVEREGIFFERENLILGISNLINWIGAHRTQLIAAFELVFAAVQEAETFFELDGPQKKAYARDLVLAALDELGFMQRAGLLFAVIDSLIGGSIEAAVHLFNKRGIFSH